MLALALALSDQALKILEALGGGFHRGKAGTTSRRLSGLPWQLAQEGTPGAGDACHVGRASINPEQAGIGEGVRLQSFELCPQVGKAGLGGLR